MRLSCTVFEILSRILQTSKRSRDSDHAPFKDGLSYVGWDLPCSTQIPNLKYLRLPSTKIWKATPNVKIFVLSHPFGGRRVTHRVHMARWKTHCRLPISDNWTFLLAVAAEALLSEIWRNRRFLKGWVTTLQQTFSTEVEFYWQKQQNRVLCHTLGVLRGNVHGSSGLL